MVTLAQLNRLDARIDALAERVNPRPTPRITYDVKLVYTGPDGVKRYSDGTEFVERPGVHVITLSLEDPRHG